MYNNFCEIKVIIFIILFILFIYFYCIDIEHYDNVIEDVPDNNKCGIACTTIDNCLGFSYGPEQKKCWLSKTPILGTPNNSIFKNDYKSTFKRCNKIQQLLDPVIATKDDYKKNATYTCSDMQKDQIQSLEIYSPTLQTKINSLDDLQNIDIDIGNYDLHIKDYPTSQLDTLKYNNIKKFVNPQIDPIPIMIQKNDEYLGQYEYKHRCVANINEKDCLSACINSNNCKGTEWNPLYVHNDKHSNNQVYHNVCCPKRLINNIIPRRKEFERGHFYIKHKIQYSDIKELKDKTMLII